MLEISDKTVGKYMIIERAGQGGMSAIFKALDTVTHEIVALKILSAAMAADPTFKARFSREIEVLRSLDHTHILPILDYGDFKGLPYIVMPFYPHGTLKSLIELGVPLNAGIRIIKQVAEALEYSHGLGITHRDVKPSNILLDEKGNAVLSDFGIAQLTDASLSLTGSGLLGTPSYMSPEQCRGKEIGNASDQYSLAVVLYEMVTGRTPFDAETPMSLMLNHLNDPIPNPRDINKNVPEEVEEVLLKALSKDPADRYASIGAFKQAFLMAATPLAMGVSPFAIRMRKLRYRFKRFRQRVSKFMDDLRRSPTFRRTVRVGLTFAIFLAIPIAYWLIVAFGFGSGEADAAPGPDGTSIAATIWAGFEQTLAAGGEGLSEEDLATAVHATIMAMIDEADGTPTPTSVGGAGGPGGPGATTSPPPGSSSKPDLSKQGATATPTPTETYTPTPTPTDTPTATLTPTPTATKTPRPTATKRPRPTSTPKPPPTATPIPVDPCEDLSYTGFSVDENYVSWMVTNSGTETQVITSAHLYWVDEPIEQQLNKVYFNSECVWSEIHTDPPTYINFGKSATCMSLDPGESKPWVFEFGLPVVFSAEWRFKTIFENGCYLWADM
jgi:serine/threonine-protein kinase